MIPADTKEAVEVAAFYKTQMMSMDEEPSENCAMSIEIESSGSFEAAADEINVDYRRRIFHLRRSLPRHEMPFALRAIRQMRAAAMDALRREFKKKRRTVMRPGAKTGGALSPLNGAPRKGWHLIGQPNLS